MPDTGIVLVVAVKPGVREAGGAFDDCRATRNGADRCSQIEQLGIEPLPRFRVRAVSCPWLRAVGSVLAPKTAPGK